MSTTPTGFVVLRGGLVENHTSRITVLDMDVLDTDTPDDPATLDEARLLRDQIAALEETAEPGYENDLATLLAEVNTWLRRHENTDTYTGRPTG